MLGESGVVLPKMDEVGLEGIEECESESHVLWEERGLGIEPKTVDDELLWARVDPSALEW